MALLVNYFKKRRLFCKGLCAQVRYLVDNINRYARVKACKLGTKSIAIAL